MLAELRLMAGDDDEPRKDVLFYTSELRTEWNVESTSDVKCRGYGSKGATSGINVEIQAAQWINITGNSSRHS